MLSAPRSRVAAAYKSLCDSEAEPLDEILQRCGVPTGERTGLIREARSRAEEALSAAAALEMEPLALTDERYPPLLSCIADPPPVLWVRGDASLVNRPTVAIVGSRVATAYAIEVAGRLAGELADRGLLVASGLARGVDSAVDWCRLSHATCGGSACPR